MAEQIEIIQIVRAFLKAQRFVRALQKDVATPLNLNESNILISIEQNPKIRPSELAERLKMTRSKVSRTIKKLETDGLISQNRVTNDSRSFTLVLSSKGKKKLAIFDSVYNQQTEAWSATLSAKQLNSLLFFLRELATSLGAPPQPSRTTENAIRTEQRRIAQAGGLLSGVLFKSNLNLLEYHIMQELVESNGVRALEQIGRLPFDLAQISRTTDTLVKAGWIRKTADPKDKRRATLAITKKGEAIFLKAEQRATCLFETLTCLSGSYRSTLLSTLNLIAALDKAELTRAINSR